MTNENSICKLYIKHKCVFFKKNIYLRVYTFLYLAACHLSSLLVGAVSRRARLCTCPLPVRLWCCEYHGL